MEGLILPPLEAPRRPSIASGASKMTQDAQKTAIWLPKTHSRHRRLQDASKMDPDTLRMVQTAPSWSKGRLEAFEAEVFSLFVYSFLGCFGTP